MRACLPRSKRHRGFISNQRLPALHQLCASFGDFAANRRGSEFETGGPQSLLLPATSLLASCFSRRADFVISTRLQNPKRLPRQPLFIQRGLKVRNGGVDRLPGKLKHPKVNAKALLAIEVQVRLHRIAGVEVDIFLNHRGS